MEDLLGKKFELLTVTGYAEKRIVSDRITHFWTVRCECGKVKNLSSSKIKSAKSCGCLALEAATDSSLRSVYRAYKRCANRDGREFQLTLEQFKLITSSNCSYCGLPPSKLHQKNSKKPPRDGGYLYNGIDRIDNSIGYKYSNCATACTECNMSKHTKSITEFTQWLDRVAIFNGYTKAGV